MDDEEDAFLVVLEGPVGMRNLALGIRGKRETEWTTDEKGGRQNLSHKCSKLDRHISQLLG